VSWAQLEFARIAAGEVKAEINKNSRKGNVLANTTGTSVESYWAEEGIVDEDIQLLESTCTHEAVELRTTSICRNKTKKHGRDTFRKYSTNNS